MTTPRESPRIRRLHSDLFAMTEMAGASDVFCFEPSGSPPDFYRVVFAGPGTVLDPSDGAVKLEYRHELEIRLGAEYPRRRPDLRWKTPLFHPNISAAGSVCLGGYSTSWAPSLLLAQLCEMLWDMLRYANFDTGNPFNQDAARWAASQTEFAFPLSRLSVRNLLMAPGVSGFGLPPVGDENKEDDDGDIRFI